MKNRREIIFIYDVKDANPNGDPDDGNRPRMDSEGYNIVTDVRLKRTIRDYWIDHKEEIGNDVEVLIRSVEGSKGELLTMEQLVLKALGMDSISKDQSGEVRLKIRQEIPEKFIDVKFFGAAITVQNANVSITGPVQFGLGRSLNKPNIQSLTITTTFAASSSKEEKAKFAGTFGETVGVDYSIICFPGIVSETTARYTGLTEKDLPILWRGLWYGTKNLNTRTKFNHSPRLLMVVVSKEEQFQIGGLNRLLKAVSKREDGKILSEKDLYIDVKELVERLKEFKDSIEKIEIKEDSLIKYTKDGKTLGSLKEILSSEGFKVEDLSL